MTYFGRRLALAFILAGGLLALVISPASSSTPSSDLAMILLTQGADGPVQAADAAFERAQDLEQPVVAEEPGDEAALAPQASPSRTAGSAMSRGPGAARPASASDGRLVRMRVTAYCPCPKCCGRCAHGITASGHRVSANGSRFVAADTRLLPFDTKVSIPGYSDGLPVPVLDTGSAIKGKRLDVFFPSHSQAQRWGSRWVTVRVHE